MSEQIAIAELSSKILGDPERYLESFSNFFEFGHNSSELSSSNGVNGRLRNLSLLSATTVIMDILPSLVLNDTHDDGDEEKKSTKDRLNRKKLAGKALEFYDELLQKLSKCKLVRGPCVMLTSGLCSRVNLGSDRVGRLVSTVISLGCLPHVGVEAIEYLKIRLCKDSRDFTDSFEVVRLIVSSICREKAADRLNLLLPVLEGLRLATVVHSQAGDSKKQNRELARDMATGRGDFLDTKKIKQNEGLILSDLIALYVRVLRSSSVFTPRSILIAINGISENVGRVNGDLALELEEELLKLAKQFLANANDDTCVLGATALSALLSISKGTKGNEILSNSIVSSTENLVPVALNKLVLLSNTNETTDLIVTLCKGALSIAAQFGSDKCLVFIAKALLNCLCTQFDDKSKTIVDLLISIASRSLLVRTAIDPEGVLVDDDGSFSDSIIGKTEIILYYQAVCLLSSYGPNSEIANLLLGHFGKHCKQISAVAGHQAILSKKREQDANLINKKRRSK